MAENNKNDEKIYLTKHEIDTLRKMRKEKGLKLREEEVLFLKAFFNLIEEGTFVKDMSIAKDKRQQFSVRIPKEFAEVLDIDPKKDKFVFKLDMPALKSEGKIELTARLVIDWNKIDKAAIDLNKIITKKDVEILAKNAESHAKIGESPFNTTELTILMILAQRRKSMNAQEITSDTEHLTWPTVNKYLYNLKDKGLVRIIEEGHKKRTKWKLAISFKNLHTILYL